MTGRVHVLYNTKPQRWLLIYVHLARIMTIYICWPPACLPVCVIYEYRLRTLCIQLANCNWLQLCEPTAEGGVSCQLPVTAVLHASIFDMCADCRPMCQLLALWSLPRGCVKIFCKCKFALETRSIELDRRSAFGLSVFLVEYPKAKPIINFQIHPTNCYN